MCAPRRSRRARAARRRPPAQRAVADQPGAEERRRLHVVEALRDRKAEALVRDDELRVAAVELVAGEARAVAEVLAPAAVAALAAGPAEPGHANPLAGREALAGPATTVPTTSWPERAGASGRELAVDDVEIRAADAAGVDGRSTCPAAGLRHRQLVLAERLSRRFEHHGLHRSATEDLGGLRLASGTAARDLLPASASTSPRMPDDLVELRLLGDERRRDLDDRVAAVVGAADEALPRRGRGERKSRSSVSHSSSENVSRVSLSLTSSSA